MSNDADPGTGTTPPGDGSTDPGQTTQDPAGSDPAADLASARKRQAGAEAARRVAEQKAADLEKELSGYRTAAQTAEQKEMTDLARETARAEAAEKKANEAQALADAKYLDRVYPNARKELPEVTDEVRLAKFEALLDEGGTEPPTPQRHNESKTNQGGTPAKPKSAADIKAELLAMQVPEGW